MAKEKRGGSPGRAADTRPARSPDVRTPPAEIRYGSRTLAQLHGYRDEMKRILAEYEAAIAVAEEIGLKELPLDGVTKGDRGLDILRGFVANVIASVQKQRFHRGR